MSRTSASPSRAFSFSMIPFFRKVNCCIHGELFTATVRVPSRKLTGRALLAICLPTTESQTSQIFPSLRRLSVGVPRNEAFKRSARAAGRGIFSLLSDISLPLFVDHATQNLADHCAPQGKRDEFPAI